jgi:hypothetical protein
MYRDRYPYPFGGHAQSATHHIEVTRLPWNLHDETYISVLYLKYSKSSRAKCHGKRCGGSLIRQGELRYGHTIQNSYGEIVQWKHW